MENRVVREIEQKMQVIQELRAKWGNQNQQNHSFKEEQKEDP